MCIRLQLMLLFSEEAALGARFVQIPLGRVNDDLRLCRLICGKAAPFRRTCTLRNLLRAGWKAQPSSLRGGGERLKRRRESRRLSASRGGRAAVTTGLCY